MEYNRLFWVIKKLDARIHGNFEGLSLKTKNVHCFRVGAILLDPLLGN